MGKSGEKAAEALQKFIDDEIAKGIESGGSKAITVTAPRHYVQGTGGVDVWSILRHKLTNVEYVGYLKGNITKYLFRAGFKGPIGEDIEKLINYAAEWLRFEKSKISHDHTEAMKRAGMRADPGDK